MNLFSLEHKKQRKFLINRYKRKENEKSNQIQLLNSIKRILLEEEIKFNYHIGIVEHYPYIIGIYSNETEFFEEKFKREIENEEIVVFKSKSNYSVEQEMKRFDRKKKEGEKDQKQKQQKKNNKLY